MGSCFLISIYKWTNMDIYILCTLLQSSSPNWISGLGSILSLSNYKSTLFLPKFIFMPKPTRFLSAMLMVRWLEVIFEACSTISEGTIICIKAMLIWSGRFSVLGIGLFGWRWDRWPFIISPKNTYRISLDAKGCYSQNLNNFSLLLRKNSWSRLEVSKQIWWWWSVRYFLQIENLFAGGWGIEKMMRLLIWQQE